MGREILLKGDTINGNFLYEIEDVSGTGASCIVYKARYYDDKKQSHLVQIKEFYPYNLEICREKNSNNLICTDVEQFETEKCRFINNAIKLAGFNNDETTNSGTPFQVDNFETNQTAYSVVVYDAGEIYSEEDLQTMELAKLLDIIKNLARAVELFHKNGYIHLDIKPENFLVDNTGHITLFDIDSVVACDEINNDTIRNISYSKKWAAPEVKHAAEKSDYKDISCKSDIFSIGVILFEAIMGRGFLPVETVSYNRNWDIENSIKAREEKQNRKVNINPKFYHKIKEIFEKTLDRNPGKRYNSAQELYDNLDKARDLLKNNPWIIPSFRTVTPQFTGRKNELSKMNSVLQKENTVFLHGFGGIGKSELALKYAEVYKDNFDTIVFSKYEDSIKDALLNIRIANYENDSNTMTLQKIAELCDERTLIILDNFDVETDADDYLDKLINNYNCKKIITTRTDFSKLYTQLDVESLGQDDAILLFEKESKWVPKTEDEEKTLNDILKLIGYHTYFTVILAKKKEMFSLSIDELRKQTEEILLKKSGKITVAKDGKLTTNTIDAIAAKLFDFNSITESQKQTLRNLYMLRWRTVSRNDYTEIAGYGMSDEEKIELMDSLNDLTRLGWVLYNAKTDDFFLHPIMQELVKDDCIKNNYSAESIVEYYQSKIEYIKKRRVSGEEREYVLFFLIKEIIFLSDLLFTISLENIHTVIDFIEKAIRFKEYGFGIGHQLKENDLLHKVVGKINEYCLTNASLEIHLKWIELLVIGGYHEHIIKYEECDYPKHCIILHDKLGISKKSKKKIKKQYWDIVRTYILYIKEDLCKKGRVGDSHTEKELIRCVEDIKNIFNKGEKGIFDTFKNGESIIFDSEPEWPEMMNTNYQKYMQKINTLQSVVKEIYTDIVSDENMTYEEKQGLKLELVDNAVKQTNHEIVYNDIVESVEFTEDEKNELLQIVFADACATLMEDLEKHVGNKTDEYANVLISYSKRNLEWLGRYETANRLQQGMFLGVILLGHYVKNKEEFITNLDVLFENLYIQYLGKNKEKLTPQCWRGICRIFSDINKLHVIYPFVNRSINIILDEQSGSYGFPFLQLLEELTGEVYKETKEDHYRKMQIEYKARMNEVSNINYKIKD